MDLLRPIVRHITFDYFLKRDGYNIGQYKAELDRSQYLSEDELAALQLEKLKDLIKFCHEQNAFYRRRFKEIGLHPDDFRHFSDLEKLPVLTKEDIRQASDRLFSDSFSKENSIHNRTGGSTGVPLHTYMDFDAAGFKKAATVRHNKWAHLVPGNRLASVWGDTERLLPLRLRLRNMLTDRAIYLDTLKFDEEHIESFIHKIHKFRPPVIMGHAHSIYRLAEYVRDNKVEHISFSGIITTAMVLTDTERRTIESVFNSPIFDRYGCEELSIIASECDAHRGLHIFAEGLYVECRGESKNLPGNLIITDLVNRAMPMIRYEIGDYAFTAEGECPCGRALPRLREVIGRTADFLYTPDKKPVFGISVLDTFVIHIPGFKQVQIIQDQYDHLDFFIVRDDAFSDESLNILKKNVIEIFGEKMRYDVNFVNQIQRTERGKFRFSICNINEGNRA